MLVLHCIGEYSEATGQVKINPFDPESTAEYSDGSRAEGVSDEEEMGIPRGIQHGDGCRDAGGSHGVGGQHLGSAG